ncbi:MAG TPA: acetyl-CoA acetyltransferase [Candidatus Limnocylindrales bacterium]|nr:acetyl-CoA acetyltransferase [Candidatus Limnocylindrales bacterium]
MSGENEIVLVGVGQCVQRDAAPDHARDPVALMADAARLAADDSTLGPRLLSQLSLVATVDTFAWQPACAPGLLAEAIGATPSRLVQSTVGGNTPQAYVNWLAGEIRSGKAGGACLIAGVNVVASMMKARAAGVRLAWPTGGGGAPERFGDERPGGTDDENAHGLFLPSNTYPLFENAVRARRGLSVREHSLAIGRMFSRFTDVAAKNPISWFPVRRSAEELATPSENNRWVSFPYTKYLNAVMAVDQSAAVILMSAAEADRLGVPKDRRVWFLGGGAASEDPWNVSERPRFDACPSMKFAAEQAMAKAGTTVADLDFFDLYSCFPVAVELACEGLGIAEDDPRGLTLTGGLPYFGGPGNNYSLHGIAAMVEALRSRPGANGLVTANGWYLTKHAAGVYSSAPPSRPALAEPPASASRHEGQPVEVAKEPSGKAVVETYTVVCGKSGEPQTGIVLGRLATGARFLAHTPDDPALLEEWMTNEAIGRRGSVRAGSPVNVFTPE